MLDSFQHYIKQHLYITSASYLHDDKTNRHGIIHGTYSDDEYGAPINFYKAIAAVDMLYFMSALLVPASWFAPNCTEDSKKLANHYLNCIIFSASNPDKNFIPKVDSRSISPLVADLTTNKNE